MQLPVPTEVDTISGNALLAACRNARRWCEASIWWNEVIVLLKLLKRTWGFGCFCCLLYNRTGSFCTSQHRLILIVYVWWEQCSSIRFQSKFSGFGALASLFLQQHFSGWLGSAHGVGDTIRSRPSTCWANSGIDGKHLVQRSRLSYFQESWERNKKIIWRK